MYKKMTEQVRREELPANVEKVYHKVNHLAREAHVRHVTIKDNKHRHLVTFPMTFGIAAALILPLIATLGLAAFLINDWKIAVEKREQE
jgi:hypothetical protein